MKKTFKKILCLVLAVVLVMALAGCAKINYVTNGTIGAIREVKSGEWQNAGTEAEGTDTAAAKDEPVIDALTPGTYGGVDFQTAEDVVKYFVEAYDYTKSLTAQYTDADGNTQTFYKLLGEESLEVGDIMIDGKPNSTINNIAKGIVPNVFSANIYGLVPCYNRNPETDNNFDDTTKKNDHDFRTSALTVDDVLACNVKEEDGKIVMEIQPKEGQMSFRGEDSQGRFFEVLGDISGAMASISVVSFSQGDATENVKVTYRGGTGKFVIDPATKEITAADYTMVANVDITHANVTVIKDKSASLIITYKNHYPASDEYLKDTKGVVRQ